MERKEKKEGGGCPASLESKMKSSQQPHSHQPFPQPVGRDHARPVVCRGPVEADGSWGELDSPFKLDSVALCHVTELSP